MKILARLPLSWLRALGWFLGRTLYVLAISRRKIALTNLRLCFPEINSKERKKWVKENFVYFAQTFLDRSWLWHAPAHVVQSRIHLTGALHELKTDSEATLLFAPHFYGLDAAGIALSLSIPNRKSSVIYTSISNLMLDDWIKKGRTRFGSIEMLNRYDGVKAHVSGLRSGQILYLLPDMDFGARETIFVPFFGVQAATSPSLSRFARIGHAKVLTVLPRVTKQGYEIDISPVWDNFPTRDLTEDTKRMNQTLENLIQQMPTQYYWVHKRFKTRPNDEKSVY